MRAIWNPRKKAMYSRLGKKFSLPPDVIKEMPNDTFLDGELWFVFRRYLVQVS